MKKSSVIFGLLAVVVLVLSACGPAATTVPTTGPALKVGMVTDTGGIDDKSFNAASWKGAQDAVTQLGVTAKYLESRQLSDYDKNIQQLISEKDDLIVTVGYAMGVNTAVAAKANPTSKFLIIDYTFPDCSGTMVEGKDCGSSTVMPNVLGTYFATDQSSLLAGYLAAGMTKTGIVGTWGGIAYPTVTIFMKGFQAGIAYYNTKHNTTVKLLGWDDVSQKGTFINSFTSTDDGKNTTASMVQEGADIILPVAGGAGVGAAAYCEAATPKCLVIGVDQDWFVTDNANHDIELTSLLKFVNVAVFDGIKAVQDGSFTGGTVNYTLANNGVGLAPYHDFDSQVPTALKTELDQVKADLISGAITVNGILGEK